MRKWQFLTEALTSTYDRQGTGNGFGDPDMNVRALPPHLLERE